MAVDRFLDWHHLKLSEDLLSFRRVPPRGIGAGQRGVVNDADAAADAEELEAMAGRKVLHEGHHLLHRCLERLHPEGNYSKICRC